MEFDNPSDCSCSRSRESGMAATLLSRSLSWNRPKPISRLHCTNCNTMIQVSLQVLLCYVDMLDKIAKNENRLQVQQKSKPIDWLSCITNPSFHLVFQMACDLTEIQKGAKM